MDNTLSLPTLFHERIFRIPDYQRGYAWEKEQVGELLEDLELLNAPRRHYAGTIVLCQVPDALPKRGADGTNYVETHIVDGQQRLTPPVRRTHRRRGGILAVVMGTAAARRSSTCCA